MNKAATLLRSPSAYSNEAIPPLRQGDRLTVEEFERRYENMPEVKKAELIEGVVYMPSPVSQEHGGPHAVLGWFLGHYWVNTPGTDAGDNCTVKGLRGVNMPQPDVILRIHAECGGQSRIENRYVSGAPELVAEVGYSTVSYDLHDKKDAYRKNGVEEYLVWRVEDQAIDWFRLRTLAGASSPGQYEPLTQDQDGILKSEVFPGLWLDPEALIGGDYARVQDVLQKGLASAEHRAFVQRLQASRSPS